MNIVLRKLIIGSGGNEPVAVASAFIDCLHVKSVYNCKSRQWMLRDGCHCVEAALQLQRGEDTGMDFQKFVDCCAIPCAVLSTEKTSDGRCGEIRIVCGNKPYRDAMGPAFYDNMLYTELVPKESTFEDFCFRSGIMGQRAHAYVRTEAHGTYTDITMIPLVRESDSLGYSLFIVEVTRGPDADRMASVSLDTAALAVRSSIALLGAEDLHEGLRQVLDDIIVQTGGFSARITLVDHERKEATNYCEAFVKGFFTDTDMVEVITPYETVVSWEKMVGYSNEVIVENSTDLDRLAPYNPEWVESLRAYGVNSLILVPLHQGKDIIGFVYVTNFDTNRTLEIKELMELMSFMISAQVSNHLLMEQLDRMSHVDGLTGLLNRRAMLRRMQEVTEASGSMSFGVINIDLNGLKAVNDCDGHDAGDRLLVQASEVLKKIFHRDDLFRTGGDEFIVIATDIEEDVFLHKVERMRSDAEKNKPVSFAIGACWSDGTTDIRTAFTHADELMYADKNAYYNRHPELYRR